MAYPGSTRQNPQSHKTVVVVVVHTELETVSIIKPLQNWQQVQTPYLCQIWHEKWASGLFLQV